MYVLDEVAGTFVDKYLSGPQGELLFASLWAKDTAIQELIARIELGHKDDNGITSFNLCSDDEVNARLLLPNSGRLKNKNSRSENHILGSLINIWIYDKSCVDPDMANRSVLILYKSDDEKPKVWEAFKELCPIPLINEWEELVMSEALRRNWIAHYDGKGINAYSIQIPDEVGEVVSDMVRRNILTLPGIEPYLHEEEPSSDDDCCSFFGEVISSYSRAQALEDGFLVDVSVTAKEAGFKWPVALTRAAWEDCVEWNDVDNEKQAAGQDIEGRLWDVLYMAYTSVKTSKDGGEQLGYELLRVPRDGKSQEAVLTKLKLVVGPGDTPDPVITIMLPHED